MSVLLETSLGDIVIDLFWEKAPLASKNFIKLCKAKYYNGALFFDVQKSYLTRVRHEKTEPTSLNHLLYGEQAKYFGDEINPEARHERFGTVSTANVGPNMNDSNFFMTLSNTNIESLNGKHTIFGVVAEGIEVLQAINEVYVDDNNRPYTNIRILHTPVLDDPFDDPPGLDIPENSPEINYEDTDRLDINDKVDLIEGNGRTEEEIIEATKQHEAKTKAIVLEMLNDLPDADIKPPDNILFVCKLNPVTQEDDLETIFSQFGPIKSCEVIRDWKTGASLQYSFIEFETQAACEEAFFKMENALIDERRIHVDFSQSVSKYWYKYKSGNPIPFNKGKGGDGDNYGGPKGRHQPRLELKNRHRVDKGEYGIVTEEPSREMKSRGNQGEYHDRKQHEKERKPRSGSRNASNERRKDKKVHEEQHKPKRDRTLSRSPKRREKERSREREKDRGRERRDKKTATSHRDKERSRSHERERGRDRERERKGSRPATSHRDKDHKNDPRREKETKHSDSRKDVKKDERRGGRNDDRKKKKASSSRSSSSSASSSSSGSRSSSSS